MTLLLILLLLAALAISWLAGAMWGISRRAEENSSPDIAYDIGFKHGFKSGVDAIAVPKPRPAKPHLVYSKGSTL